MADPRIVHRRADLRQRLGTIAPGLVPTMGALHEGHRSLIARAASEHPVTVVSVFVNPTQFNDPADYAAYPRTLERDADDAFAAGADLVFAPSAADMYPPGFATTVTVAGLTDRWEGAARPGHFAGVATVVCLLLNSVRPAASYFGEKDFQQLQVIRRMHADLALPGDIVGCPTVRDADGLALSSRNARLSAPGREAAAAIPAALRAMDRLASSGETSTEAFVSAGLAVLEADPGIVPDYLAVVDPATLEPVEKIAGDARALVAAVVDGVRLLDNAALVPGQRSWVS